MEEKIDTKTINKRIKKLDDIVKTKTQKSFEAQVGKEVLILIEGESSEHEFFMGARELLWAPNIDGEILVNESDIEGICVGGCYRAKISECAGDKLIATITSVA